MLPWPTALLAEYASGVAVLVYGLTSTAMALTFNLLWRYLIRRTDLHKPGVDPSALKVRDRRFAVGLVIYPVATAVGLLNTYVFLAIMIAAGLHLLPTPELRT